MQHKNKNPKLQSIFFFFKLLPFNMGSLRQRSMSSLMVSIHIRHFKNYNMRYRENLDLHEHLWQQPPNLLTIRRIVRWVIMTPKIINLSVLNTTRAKNIISPMAIKAGRASQFKQTVNYHF